MRRVPPRDPASAIAADAPADLAIERAAAISPGGAADLRLDELRAFIDKRNDYG